MGHVENRESKSMSNGNNYEPMGNGDDISVLRTVMLHSLLRFLEKFPEKKKLLQMPT